MKLGNLPERLQWTVVFIKHQWLNCLQLHPDRILFVKDVRVWPKVTRSVQINLLVQAEKLVGSLIDRSCSAPGLYL